MKKKILIIFVIFIPVILTAQIGDDIANEGRNEFSIKLKSFFVDSTKFEGVYFHEELENFIKKHESKDFELSEKYKITRLGEDYEIKCQLLVKEKGGKIKQRIDITLVVNDEGKLLEALLSDPEKISLNLSTFYFSGSQHYEKFNDNIFSEKLLIEVPICTNGIQTGISFNINRRRWDLLKFNFGYNYSYSKKKYSLNVNSDSLFFTDAIDITKTTSNILYSTLTFNSPLLIDIFSLYINGGISYNILEFECSSMIKNKYNIFYENIVPIWGIGLDLKIRKIGNWYLSSVTNNFYIFVDYKHTSYSHSFIDSEIKSNIFSVGIKIFLKK